MESIFTKQVHPFKQLLFAWGFAALVMLLGKALMISGSIESNPVFYWEICLAALLSYSLFNCIFSVTYKNRKQYFPLSILSFACLAILGGLMAHQFSGISVDEAGSIRWLLIVFTFSYLVFISIVNMMKFVMDFAKKQDARLRGEDV